LTKRYGHLTALSEVSFSVRPGEVLGLIGPNGSGKTTLFECLGGVLPADGGRVLVDGGALASSERTATMFYLPDGIAPWPAQTVRWALRFVTGFFGEGESVGPAKAGLPVPEDRSLATVGVSGFSRPSYGESGFSQPSHGESGFSRPWHGESGFSRTSVTDIVRELDLEPLLDSPIGTLSKGQRKRALLAIGLLTPQPILLADEPFDGLDLRQSRDVARVLRAHAAAGRTLVLSIHQITDAARVCDRFVLLSGGRVRGEGTLDELSAVAAAHGVPSAALEEVFLALT
jgi:ABC-2 type transport system ATP-binding protein